MFSGKQVMIQHSLQKPKRKTDKKNWLPISQSSPLQPPRQIHWYGRWQNPFIHPALVTHWSQLSPLQPIKHLNVEPEEEEEEEESTFIIWTILEMAKENYLKFELFKLDWRKFTTHGLRTGVCYINCYTVKQFKVLKYYASITIHQTY